MAHLTDRGDHLLGGTLRLPDVWPLTDAVLVYDRWAYPLPAGAAGRNVRRRQAVGTANRGNVLSAHYRLRREERAGTLRSGVDRSGPDSGNDDVPLALTGGEVYTNLANRAQGYVDLSSQVRLGRAVLVGRAPRPAAIAFAAPAAIPPAAIPPAAIRPAAIRPAVTLPLAICSMPRGSI